MRDGLDDLPPDYQAFTIPVYASVACAQLGDEVRAKRLHELLEPHRGRAVTTGAGWFGTMAHYLGLLAAGGSRSPEELASMVGIDLADPGFWDSGLDLVEAQLRAAEELVAKRAG